MANNECIQVSLTEVINKIDEMQEELGKISIIVKSIQQKEGDLSGELPEAYICQHPKPGPWKVD